MSRAFIFELEREVAVVTKIVDTATDLYHQVFVVFVDCFIIAWPETPGHAVVAPMYHFICWWGNAGAQHPFNKYLANEMPSKHEISNNRVITLTVKSYQIVTDSDTSLSIPQLCVSMLMLYVFLIFQGASSAFDRNHSRQQSALAHLGPFSGWRSVKVLIVRHCSAKTQHWQEIEIDWQTRAHLEWFCRPRHQRSF